MNRLATLGLTALVLFAVLTGGASLAMAEEETTEESDESELDNLSIGEQISGAMSAQSEAVEGDLDRHAFGMALADAESDEERANLIANRTEDIQNRVASQAETKAELREAYQAGDISRGEYVSGLSAQGAEYENAQEDVDDVENATEGIPQDVLEANGVNTEALETLRTNASELAGPEVASVAKTIAGPDRDVSIPDTPGQNGGAGPGDNGPDSSGSGDDGAGDSDPSDNGSGDSGSGSDSGGSGGPDDRPGGPDDGTTDDTE